MNSPHDMPQRIALIRRNAKLSQVEFGKKIGVSQPTVSAMEKTADATTAHSAKSICAIFHVREEYLLYGDGEMYSPVTELIVLYHRMTEYEQNMILHIARKLGDSEDA